MSSVRTREDHVRNQRRRVRQALGMFLTLLMIIGAVTVIQGGVSMIRSLFDDTAAKQEYEDKLEGLVLFDPLPFDGIANIDDLTLRQAAVWGCVYNIQETQGGFDNFAHDADTDELLLPSVEVDAYLAKIVGPSFKLNHQSFESEDMSIEYDESLQSYRIPVTGSVGYYRATVVDLFKKNGKLHVTVGYIPLMNTSDFTTTPSDTPTKYMDYLFERVGGSWYLTGLTESETKPEVTATEESANSTVVVTDDLQSVIAAGVSGEDAASSDEVFYEAAETENDTVEIDIQSGEDGEAESDADSEETADSTNAAD